jgi:hypothetical protein
MSLSISNITYFEELKALFGKTFVKVMVYLMLFAMISSVIVSAVFMFL